MARGASGGDGRSGDIRMTKPRGGARPNAGALVQSVELSKEDWRTLRIILLARYGKADKETVNTFFAGLIRQEWQAYDERISELSAG